MLRRRLLTSALALPLLGRVQNARAVTWPERPVRIIVPFGAGGASDIVARLIAAPLQTQFGQPFVIDNRPGAGGTLGAAAAAAAAAATDGHTLVISAHSPIVIGPAMYNVPYDPMRSFRHIALVGVIPFVALVRPDKLPVTDLRGLAEAARRSPTPIPFASAGNGALGHIVGLAFMKSFGVQLEHVPYRNASMLQSDLAAGNIPMTFDGLPQMLNYIRNGTLRPLAVTTATRSPRLPEVPTAAEAGAPEMAVDNWLGVSAPASLPDEAAERVFAAIDTALQSAEIVARMDQLGFMRQPLTSAGFTAMLQDQVDSWAPMIRAANIRPD
ncbi:Bug family tripartite tricarboxylate transporter substrate binding protein [Falsiroseomonas sp. HW251]|uniref:Bug family tripartite tricarboxylate transporter substrate binding protein n=1 Tax=Falsiroseomonas sp. HW251 TaxID=3390998 RepID=UPI003D3181D5